MCTKRTTPARGLRLCPHRWDVLTEINGVACPYLSQGTQRRRKDRKREREIISKEQIWVSIFLQLRFSFHTAAKKSLARGQTQETQPETLTLLSARELTVSGRCDLDSFTDRTHIDFWRLDWETTTSKGEFNILHHLSTRKKRSTQRGHSKPCLKWNKLCRSKEIKTISHWNVYTNKGWLKRRSFPFLYGGARNWIKPKYLPIGNWCMYVWFVKPMSSIKNGRWRILPDILICLISIHKKSKWD